MSADTTADKQLYSALDNLYAAQVALGEIVVDECDGHDDYNEEHRQAMADALIQVIAIRKSLRA